MLRSEPARDRRSSMSATSLARVPTIRFMLLYSSAGPLHLMQVNQSAAQRKAERPRQCPAKRQTGGHPCRAFAWRGGQWVRVNRLLAVRPVPEEFSALQCTSRGNGLRVIPVVTGPRQPIRLRGDPSGSSGEIRGSGRAADFRTAKSSQNREVCFPSSKCMDGRLCGYRQNAGMAGLQRLARLSAGRLGQHRL